MNYRHAFHAGNFADVIKHVALVGILLHLRKKEKPFRVIDTHAGRGLYEIAAGDALRTGEAQDGIGRLRDVAASPSTPQALSTYLDIARAFGPDRYPGSPLIAARLLRETDHLIAIERQPAEARALAEVLSDYKNAKGVGADGYARLASLLPPPERRGLVLIDPPYEVEDEFTCVVKALREIRRRFATGIVLAWYPRKSRPDENAFVGEIRSGGTQTILRVLIDVDGGVAEKDRLTAAGLLVVNPPFGMDEEMESTAQILAPLLGRSGRAEITVENL